MAANRCQCLFLALPVINLLGSLPESLYLLALDDPQNLVAGSRVKTGSLGHLLFVL